MGTRVHYSEVVTKPHLIDLVEDDWLLDTLPDDGACLVSPASTVGVDHRRRSSASRSLSCRFPRPRSCSQQQTTSSSL
jgi:hypothetical protein